MPSGIFPVPEFRPVPTRTGPSLAVRIRTRWRRNRLDERLSRGADPATSAELSLRAAQLRSRIERARLANTRVDARGDAGGPNLGPFRVTTRRQHAVIRESADELLALVARLRDDEPVDVRGAAMTALLVDDHASSLQRDGGQNLPHEMRAARLGLDSTDSSATDLAAAA
jgi:hypothetical protein